MGKISKFANIYYKSGQKRTVTKNKYGQYELKDVTMQELEDMIDTYPSDADPMPLDYMKYQLFQMYNKYGNPHEKDLIERIKAEAAKKTTESEVKEKLEEIKSEVDAEYIDFEEVKEAA